MTILEFLRDNWIDLLCILFCFIHTISSVIHARLTGKKITALCNLCGSPLLENEEHSCSLSSTQLHALTAFVASLKNSKE